MAIATKLIPALSQSDKRRFFSKVSKIPTDTGCLEWESGKISEGYGQFWAAGRNFRSHRIAFILAIGIDPCELKVCHSCNNPACCNPAHLSIGTDKDNADDRNRAGRTAKPKGEKNGQAKLTEHQVVAIRSDTRLYREIALDFNINKSHVGDIKRRTKWAHVA